MKYQIYSGIPFGRTDQTLSDTMIDFGYERVTHDQFSNLAEKAC